MTRTLPRLFSYGTLQRDDVQLSTFGRLLQGQRDELPGFEVGQAVDASGATHANVVRTDSSDSRVSGTVFEIAGAELAAADQYEHLAGYVRMAATLVSGREAWVYVAGSS